MRELLERLCALNAVSSWEDEVRAFLLAEVEPHADRLRVDALGNLIAWKKGRKHTGSKLLLTAHMDEVGLMIRQITDDGYLKFDTVGAIDRRVLLGKPVLVGPKRVPGVVGLKAYHLVSREEEKSVPKLDEFYIDIGARDRAGAEAQVALGDTAAFDSDAGDFGAGLFQGKALGSRLGCAVLLTLYRPEGGGGPRGLRRGLLRHPGGGAGGGRRGCCGSGRSARPQAGMQLGRRCGAALYGSGRYCRPGAL
mgnify:CR=1 FL=1